MRLLEQAAIFLLTAVLVVPLFQRLKLGLGIAAAERAVTLFKQHDEEQLEAQHAVHHDEAQLIQTTQQAAEQLKEVFEADIAYFPRQSSGVTAPS